MKQLLKRLAIFCIVLVGILLFSSVASAQWTEIGNPTTINETTANSSVMKIINGQPWIAYSGGSNYQLSVKKFNGSSWESVGTTYLTTGRVGVLDMAYHNGNLYVAFNNNLGTTVFPISVMQYNIASDTWINLGNSVTDLTMFSNGSTVKIVVASNGTPYIAIKDRNTNSNYLLHIFKYDVSSWQEVETLTGINNIFDFKFYNDNFYLSVSYTDTNALYGKVITSTDGDTWDRSNNAIPFTNTGGLNSINVNAGEFYHLSTSQITGSTFEIKKYDGSTWIALGNTINLPSMDYTASIAFDNVGNPVINYSSNEGEIIVAKYTNNGLWEILPLAPGQNDITGLNNNGSIPYIQTDGDIFYSNYVSSTGKIFVKKYESTPSTQAVPNYTVTDLSSGVIGGTILSEGASAITQRGFVFSLKADNANPGLNGVGCITYADAANTIGSLSKIITGLQPNTEYAFKVFATNSFGTSYSSVYYFSTNQSPQITSGGGLATAVLSTPENTPFSATITATDADVPAQNLTFSINGGADASKFTINQATGVLSLNATPDYENPTDADTNNAYIVTVQVTDNGNDPKSFTQTITVSVTNIAENPIVNNASTSSVGITGAAAIATVVSDGGGGTITERGFVYALTSANSNPSIGGTGTTKVIVGSTGSMSKLLSGLTANTAYTAKAFATNATGTGYSDIFSFTTNKLTAGPSISYDTPIYLQQNTVISAVSPSNIGSAIPALTYKQVSTFAGTAKGYLEGTGTSAKMDGPQGMTMDADGNIYFADISNQRIRKVTPEGVTTLIAGSGYTSFGFGGYQDNTTGASARFNFPTDLALDTANNCLYVADKENNKIRKIALTSPYAVTTFAGSGNGSVDATGTAAKFDKPQGITIDPSGTYLYVTDRAGRKIRRITISTAVVTTIAGAGTSGSADNATGTLATFNEPAGIIATADFLYVADFGANKIRKIATTSPYAVTTVAGSGTASSIDGTGTAATFNTPFALTLDGFGNIFMTEYGNKIRKITPEGVVTTIAGSGASTSVDGIGTAATFDSPAGIVINPITSMAYVSEYAGDQIRELALGGYSITPILPTGLAFDASTGTISGTPTVVTAATDYTVSGYNYNGSSTTNLNITIANLPTITTDAVITIASSTAVSGGNVTNNGGISLKEKGICWSTSPNPTIGDNKIVSETTTAGAFISNLTGLNSLTTYYVRAYAINEMGTSYGAEVSFTSLMLPPNISYITPNQFTINTAITPLQVTNTGGVISTTSSLINLVTTFAGSGLSGSTDGTGTAASFSGPNGIAVAADGNFYVADTFGYKIRKITPTGVVTTFAGNGTEGAIDGTGTAASFMRPAGMTLDALGNIYVSDLGNHNIRKITLDGVVTTFAGSGISGSTNGTGTAASFWGLNGLAFDRAGNLYVADTNNNIIRKITPAGAVTTFAGSGVQGSVNGTGTTASFYLPCGLAVDAADNIYVGGGDKRIRKITPDGVVTTFAGSGLSGSTDGTSTTASFGNIIGGIAVDAAGNLIVTDNSNSKIRKITPDGVVSTIAGSGDAGSTDGLGTQARFSSPYGVALDATGNIYVTEKFNDKIRRISSLVYSVSPALPAGLVLNDDGSISGTPTVLCPTTDYTVTAYNSGGSGSYIINLAVTAALGIEQNTYSKAIVAYPNPFSDTFKIDVATNSSDAVTVAIYDMSGKKLETHKGTPTEISALQYGNEYSSGVYNVVITQGTEVKTLRVIKK